jgi:hypothetical protein
VVQRRRAFDPVVAEEEARPEMLKVYTPSDSKPFLRAVHTQDDWAIPFC